MSSKIGLVIKREYLSRVMKKTFILTTILTPLVFVVFIAGATLLSLAGRDKQSIVVNDPSDRLGHQVKGGKDVSVSYSTTADTSNFAAHGFTGIITAPPDSSGAFVVRTEKGLGLGAKSDIEDQINKAIEDRMLQQAGIHRSRLDSIHTLAEKTDIRFEVSREGGSRESSQELSYGIGYACGILIYITMFIYGAMVMRGVMEEKTSRIAEVIVSSVKPFDLMLGKVIGIGMVGLTQFLMWIVLIIVLSSVVQSFIPHEVMSQVQQMQQNGGVMGGNMNQASEAAQKIYKVRHALGNVNWPLIISCFLFYFIGGYLFYAALFAAVGSVVDDPQNAQSLMFPITMPIIFSFIIMSTSVQNPEAPIAVWASIIPFSAPMVMMARLAYGVPDVVAYWQLALSMILLVLGFLFTTWLCARIYRTGILLYGKKITWKEMIKWGFRKA